jgi:hypothetical protein
VALNFNNEQHQLVDAASDASDNVFKIYERLPSDKKAVFISAVLRLKNINPSIWLDLFQAMNNVARKQLNG